MQSSLVLYLLAYIGCFSLALWFARLALPKLAARIENQSARSLLCLGLPVFVFTTYFNWLFPSHLNFAEHVLCNLVFAGLVSFAWRYPIQNAAA